MSLMMDHVVIAEDDYEISRLVKSYFERVYGLSVFTTSKVERILPLVLETRASVLIMDLELADGDASQILGDVASITDLLVIILTGTWRNRQENRLLQEGAQVVMRKPQKPATIWQQVLNLRRAIHPEQVKTFRIQVRGQGVFYDLQDGMILEVGGKRTYLSDKKREIMDVLVRNLLAYQELSGPEKRNSGGWVNRQKMIRQVFGQQLITSDLENSFWYHLRAIKKTLPDCVVLEDGQALIENRRVGRSESYYRLNPSIFSLTPGKEA